MHSNSSENLFLCTCFYLQYWGREMMESNMALRKSPPSPKSPERSDADEQGLHLFAIRTNLVELCWGRGLWSQLTRTELDSFYNYRSVLTWHIFLSILYNIFIWPLHSSDVLSQFFHLCICKTTNFREGKAPRYFWMLLAIMKSCGLMHSL